jgi:hypothetical protein
LNEAVGNRTRNLRIDSPNHESSKHLPAKQLSQPPAQIPADSPATELAQLVIVWQHLTRSTRSAIRMLIDADRTNSTFPQ